MSHGDKPTPVALVTGGASGIGRAIGDEFSARGWRVFLADIDGPALSAAAAGRGGVEGRVLDVTDPEDTAMLRTSRVHRLDRQKLLAGLPYAPMPVDSAARRIVDGALRGAAVIVPAFLSRALWWLHRLSPRASVWVGRRVVARVRAARLDDGT